MAYMSSVTHHKLVGKYTTTTEGWGGAHQSITFGQDSVVPPRDLGVVSCGSFEAAIRCCATAAKSGSVRDVRTWTGEADGTTTIRRAWTGERLCTVDKKKGVFVSCLRHHGAYMYAGMSDGCLRAFVEDDSEGYTLVSEAKKHTGDILCIESVGKNVFTGSRDWQVFVWRWDGDALTSVDQFSGHTLAVRCLSYEAGLLYSGGDDRVIRCINMNTGEEVTTATGFPIAGTRGGIKCLCATDAVLFSGDEESLNVWSSRTGDHVKLLLKSEGAILTLMKDPHAQRIWSAGVDGVIRLWNGSNGFELMCSLDDHNGSFVRGLVPLTTVGAAKTWTVGRDGTLRMWYTESDCSEFDSVTTLEENALMSSIDSLRDVIVNNYSKLEGHKAELQRLQDEEARRKGVIATTFERVTEQDLKRRYFAKLMHRLLVVRRWRKNLAIVESLALSTRHGRLATYYHALERYRREQGNVRRRRNYGEAIMRSTDDSLKILYYRKLRAHARRVVAGRRRYELADTLLRSTAGGTLRAAYLRLQQFTAVQRQKRKRRNVSHTLFRHTKNGLLFAYWGKLVQYYKMEKTAAQNGTLTDTLMRTLYRSCRAAYFSKWLRWYKRKTDTGRRKRVGQILGRLTTHGVLRIYFSKLLEHRIERQCESMASRHHDMLKSVKKLENKLKAAQYITEEELVQQIEQLESEESAIQGIVRDLEREEEALRVKQELLEKELKGHLHFDKNATPQEKVLKICCFLKARGVSCRRDIKSITEAAKASDRGTRTFKEGVRSVKQTIQQATGQRVDPTARHWNISAEAMRYIDAKYIAEVHRGVRDIIIGVDQMAHFKTEFPKALCTEVVDNIHVLYECVSRIYSERVSQEESEWKIKQAVIREDPYATQHGRLLNKTLNRVLPSNCNLQDLVNRDKSGGAAGTTHADIMAASTATVSRRPTHSPAPKKKSSSKKKTAKASAAGGEEQQQQPGSGFTESRLMAEAAGEPAAAADASEKPAAAAKPSRGVRRKPDPGFKVSEVLEVTSIHSKFAKAGGLAVGDKLTAVNLQMVSDKAAYVHIVKNSRPGDTLDLAFKRGSAQRVAKVKVGEMLVQ